MEAIVFIIFQIFFATRAVLKIGEYLTIRPVKGYGVNSPWGEGYWTVALEGEGSNCFGIIQLGGQKIVPSSVANQNAGFALLHWLGDTN